MHNPLTSTWKCREGRSGVLKFVFGGQQVLKLLHISLFALLKIFSQPRAGGVQIQAGKWYHALNLSQALPESLAELLIPQISLAPVLVWPGRAHRHCTEPSGFVPGGMEGNAGGLRRGRSFCTAWSLAEPGSRQLPDSTWSWVWQHRLVCCVWFWARGGLWCLEL